MKNFTRLLFTGVLFMLFSNYGMAQQSSQFTSVVGKLVRTTPKLSEIDRTTMYGEPLKITRDEHGIIGGVVKQNGDRDALRNKYPGKNQKDMALQGNINPSSTTAAAVINQNFDGITATGFAPSDNNMAVGPNHVIQIINHSSGSQFIIWNKAGGVVQAPTVLSTLTGIAGSGDPVVMYDQIADRWILTEFAGANINTLVWAVSTTNNPTGTYKIYSYTFGYSADYPHYSVWHNAYYGITHDFNPGYVGSSIYAFDRAAMLAGAATATVVSFRFDQTPEIRNRIFTNLPVHQEGPATSNQSGLFSFFEDDSDTGDPLDVDSIFTFTYTPNFTTPANSVIGPMESIVSAPFNSTLCGVAACITQPAGGPAIRGIEGQLMHKVSYRNFGAYESMVANFTTNAGSAIGGVRWWELRRTGGAGLWSMYQQGTVAPGDGNHRFMGSITQNANGDIGLVYNVTGPGTPPTFPAFRLTGRTTCDPLGTMSIPETSIIESSIVNGTNRMGDYNTLSVDPVNGSFWGVGQYNKTGLGTFGNWATRMVNFNITGGGAQITSQPANAIVCAGTTASFSVTASAGGTISYQWQVSTNGGGTWTNIAGAIAAAYSFTAVAGDNGKQFRCIVSSAGCPVVATSNAAILTITTLSQGGTITSSSSNACAGPNSTTLTLTGSIGNIIRWESSIDGGATWTNIANTTATLTVTNLTQTTMYRAYVQSSGCTAAYSTTATVTFVAAGIGALTINTDNGTTLCAGDPTLLTVVAAPIPGTVTANSGAISVVIPDANATGISTSLNIAGVPAAAVGSSASVTFNITHTWDSDLTLFLKAPNNQVLNLVNARGGSGDNFVNTVISSTAVTPIASGTPPFTGTFLPDGSLAAPAPTGFAPTAATFTPLINTAGQLNGTWSFGARDGAGGDIGTITSWGLTLNYGIPGGPPAGATYVWSPAAGLNATNTNPVVASPNTTSTYTVVATNGSGCTGTASITINVNQRPAVTTQPANASICTASSATFSITGTGTNITYQWQESTNAGVSWTNLNNGTPYAGVNTATLVINPVSAAMNNNRYRCVVSGLCTPSANSNGAILTVKALPAVTVTPTSGCGGVAGTNGLALTASGGDTYVWSPAAGLYTNTGTTTAYTGTNLATVYAAPTAFTIYTVTGTNTTTGCNNTAVAIVNYTPPAPAVTPNPVAMCLGDAAVKLKSSSSTTTIVNFASGAISIAVPDNTPNGVSSNLSVSGIPANATISRVRVTLNMPHTYIGDMIFNLKAPNGNIFALDKYLGATGNSGANFTNTVISSAGTTALSAGTAPFTGTFKADGSLAVPFAIVDPTGFAANVTAWSSLYSVPNGTWTLAMADGGPADLGTLTSWSIEITYVQGVPATPAVWSPISGLFSDANATTAYVAGTSVDSVWTRPTPTGVYNYQATVNSLPPAPAVATMNNTATNFFTTLTFNVRNNNNYAVTLSDISSVCFQTGATNVSAYYKAAAINGLPGAITTANGWNQIGSAVITSVGFPTIQPFLTGLTLVIPANTTYGILISADQAGAGNLVFSNTGTNLIASGGGCDIITGTNIGYTGPAVPGAPTFTPYHFIGSIGVVPGVTACTSPPRIVVVTVNQPISITAQPVNAAVCTDKVTSFTVGATGTTPTYQWQVSTDGGNTFANISNGGVYAGVTTATLTITAPPVSMSGNLYRCVVSGAAPCASVPSAHRLLTVNPLPTVVISASLYKKLFPGLKTTISSTVSPAAALTGGYTWLRNGTAVPNASASSLVVDIDGLGDYILKVKDVNGCENTSNLVSITDSVSGKVFIYPNPNSGQFQVRYYSIINNTGLPRGINVYDARGKRVLTQTYSITAPYARMNVDLRNHGTGVYWIEVVDVIGNRLAMGRAEVLR